LAPRKFHAVTHHGQPIYVRKKLPHGCHAFGLVALGCQVATGDLLRWVIYFPLLLMFSWSLERGGGTTTQTCALYTAVFTQADLLDHADDDGHDESDLEEGWQASSII
jgi:hypothetical protein